MRNCKLENVDIEELEYLLVDVEKSFGIKFNQNELAYTKTFGELFDHISNKIQLDNSDNCTKQQAFYKLREALISTIQIDKSSIITDLQLESILPRRNRQLNIKKIEKKLGLKLNILRPPHWRTGILFVILLFSIAGLFINSTIGGACLVNNN